MRLEIYRVKADAVTGEWLGDPERISTVDAGEWAARVDTEGRHFDTYEVLDVTRAVEVVFSEGEACPN